MQPRRQNSPPPDLRRFGFTLTELLVVITVIAILVSLSIPAAQQAREAARRTQCRSNLRQIGLAAHQFAEVTGAFPASGRTISSRLNPAGAFIGWRAELLPYLEQSALHTRYDFDRHWWHDTNTTAGQAVLPIFLCPSTPDQPAITAVVAKPPRPQLNFTRPLARADYEAVMGIRPHFDPQQYDRQERTRSVMHRNSSVRFADITDGTSQTIMVTECAARPVIYRRRRSTTARSDQGNGWIDSESAFSLDGASRDGIRQGIDADNATGMNATNENEPYSFHPGGCLFLFADGHVSWLSEDTDLQVLAGLITRAGEETIPSF